MDVNFVSQIFFYIKVTYKEILESFVFFQFQVPRDWLNRSGVGPETRDPCFHYLQAEWGAPLTTPTSPPRALSSPPLPPSARQVHLPPPDHALFGMDLSVHANPLVLMLALEKVSLCCVRFPRAETISVPDSVHVAAVKQCELYFGYQGSYDDLDYGSGWG